MVRLPILLMLAVSGPALAAQTALTVDQFENTELPALHSMNDKRAARTLASMKLAERASRERAARWQAEMPGKKAAEALTALVDAASFLDPPVAERSATPPPAIDAQKQMLTETARYVEGMLHKLPNFYARRTTLHFETATDGQLLDQQRTLALHGLGNSPPPPLSQLALPALPHQELGPIDRKEPMRGSLFFVADEEVQVTYANGKEVESALPGPSRGGGGASLGLATSGEFGPILLMVLRDAMERGLSWSRWEQGANGPLAVFRYEVPQNLSHYEIVSWLGKPPYFPAYHGELTLDPSTGAILRITIQSSGGNNPDQSLDSGILVEYAPVDIGGRIYTCPVHSVAISRAHKSGDGEGASAAVEEPTFLNDVAFLGYHLFRGEVRILP